MSIIRDGFQSADLDVPVVLPTLNLDFANSQELDPRITFSRGSIGTFVNKNGLIETAAANIPRFDYDPISGECRGLLIEESRVNNFLYSEDFSNAYWSKSNVSIISNAATAPDGTLTADLNTGTGAPNISFVERLFTTLSAGTYTFSYYAKSSGQSRGNITYIDVFDQGVGGDNTNRVRATVNLNTGVISPIVGTSARYNAQNVGNGWWRIIGYWTTTNPVDARFRIGDNASGGIYIWGAQVESGSFPTSYIPTTTSSVTRSADNADMTGSNFTSWANSSVGTFVIRGRGGQSTTQTLRGRFVGLGVGAGAISLEGASTTVSIWDNTNTIVVTNNSADVVNRNSNIAASFDGTLRRIVLNGVASSGISRRNINTIFTQISLGKNGSNNNYLNGTLSRVAYYPRRLNDAQMLYLTQ